MSLKQMKQEFLKAEKEEQQKAGIHGNDRTAAHSSSTTTTTTDPLTSVDSETALKNFLDSIPISLIPDIKNNNFHELKVEDTLYDAIKMLLEKNLYGAPIADAISSNSPETAANVTATKKASNRYIGFLSVPTMALWCLEELEKNGCFHGEEPDASDGINNGFFGLLDQNPSIGQTKVRELAKSFLWDPFFPVHLEVDTLFRGLLLFSKHRIHVLPVTDKTDTGITGFVTQNALLELLLQSSGLEWFDGIANLPLSEFRFNNEERAPQVYADQSVCDALRIMRQNKAGVVAVVERGSKELVGNFRSFDIHLLLDNDELFNSIRTTTMSEFIQLDSVRKGNTESNHNVERNPGSFISSGDLHLRNDFVAKMSSPVTHKMTDTLKQAMKTMVETRTEISFLIGGGSQQIPRAVTSRNIIMEFAPPGVDTRLRGGGFFETALEQTGCHFERGTLFRDH